VCTQLRHDKFMQEFGTAFRNENVTARARAAEIAASGPAIFPHNLYLRMWTTVILTLVLFTAIRIPYTYAFRPANSLTWFLVDLLVDLLFIIDVFVNFRTAFYHKRVYVLSAPTSMC